MNYKYRVTLPGIKGFFRVYTLSGSCSLYSFHKQLRSDLEFTVDQPILFKALSQGGEVLARYALIDLGFGTVDKITVDSAVKAGAASFVYFYDTAAKKSVILTLEGEEEGEPHSPCIIESKGPNPIEFENGYVAFEDLPEDRKRRPVRATDDLLPDDEDEDEDEGEDEEGAEDEEELIYDADE